MSVGGEALVAHARAQVLGGRPDSAAATLRRLLVHQAPDGADRPALVTHLAFAELMRGRFAVAHELLARESAARTSSDAALHAALALASAMVGPTGGVSPAEVDRRLDRAHRLRGDRAPGLRAYLLVEAAMSAGRLPLAERVAADALSQGAPPADLAVALRQALARSLLFQGRLDEADTACDAAVEQARSTGHSTLLGVALGVRALLAAQRGQRAAVRCAVSQALDAVGTPASSYLAGGAYTLCAYAFATDGQHAPAAATLLRGAGGDDLPRLQWVDRAYGYELLTGAALASGDLCAAQGWLARAEALPGGGMATAAVERTRARVVAAEGDPDGAVAAAGRAELAATGAGGELDAARARVLRGTALSHAGARQGALAELQHVADLAVQLGALRLRADAAREIRRLGRRVRSGATGWDALTTREREVAVLVADGMTSRQVARELHVSERTVHSHLASVMRALGATTRAALPHLVPRTAPVEAVVPPQLTARQVEVVELVALGLTNREVAERLRVSPKTVEKHVADLFTRWGARSRTELAARWRACRGSGDDLLPLAEHGHAAVGHGEAPGAVHRGVEAD